MTAATNTEAAHVSCNGTNIIFLSIYNTGEKKTRGTCRETLTGTGFLSDKQKRDPRKR